MKLIVDFDWTYVTKLKEYENDENGDSYFVQKNVQDQENVGLLFIVDFVFM